MRYSFTKDRLLSTRLVSNPKGEAVVAKDFGAYGEPVDVFTREDLVDNNVNKARYTGHVYDDIAGLYYAKARTYDPTDKRFTSLDPVMDGLNWYEYCRSNPLKYTDPTGNEEIVVSGGHTSGDYKIGEDGKPRPYEEFTNQFIETALHDIGRKVEVQRVLLSATGFSYKPEEITWIVMNYNYTDDEISKFKEAVSQNRVQLKVLNSKEEFIDYINNKNGEVDSRTEDPITSMSFFSHGVPGSLAFSYDSKKRQQSKEYKDLYFNTEDIDKLNSSAFNNTFTRFYSCNTGTEVNKKSFAQEWSNKTGGTSQAVVNNKTSYRNINITPNHLRDIEKGLKSIDRSVRGFSYTGSLNLPVPSGTKGTWTLFYPDKK